MPGTGARGQRSDEERQATRVAADYLECPETAPVVRGLYERYLSGESLGALSRWLVGQGRRGGRGSYTLPSNIRPLLSNPVYIGRLPVRAEGRSGRLLDEVGGPAVNVEPIVAPSVWQAVRAIRVAQAGIPPRSRGGWGVWGGLVVCDACGGRYYATHRRAVRPPAGWPDGMQVYYQCSRRRQGVCAQPGVTEDALWGLLREPLVDALDPAAVQARADERRAEDQARAARLLDLEAALDRLMTAYSHPDSRMTAEELHRRRAPLDDELASLRAVVPPPPPRLPVVSTRAEVEALLRSLTREEAREVVQRTWREVRVRDGALAADPVMR